MKNEQVIAAIKQANGNLTAAARMLGVNRLTIYRHAQQHATVRQAIDESRESMIDMAESMLYRKVIEGSTPELLFFLKTQGRRRGYVERQEHVVYTPEQLQQLSDEEFDALYAEQSKRLGA